MGQTFWGSGGSDKNEMINLEIDVRIPQSLSAVAERYLLSVYRSASLPTN